MDKNDYQNLLGFMCASNNLAVPFLRFTDNKEILAESDNNNCIYVSIPLVANLDTQDFSFVLGHELGHIISHHLEITDNISKIVAFNRNVISKIPMGIVQNDKLFVRMLERKQEFKADLLSDYFCRNAGISVPLSVFDKLGTVDELYFLTDSHPLVAERKKNFMENRIEKIDFLSVAKEFSFLSDLVNKLDNNNADIVKLAHLTELDYLKQTREILRGSSQLFFVRQKEIEKSLDFMEVKENVDLWMNLRFVNHLYKNEMNRTMNEVRFGILHKESDELFVKMQDLEKMSKNNILPLVAKKVLKRAEKILKGRDDNENSL